jgi:hypothetical protein
LILCFGYLLGVVLRLFRTDKLDSWSGIFNSWFKPRWKEGPPYIKDPFFYNRWMIAKCERYDDSLKQFYDTYWKCRDREKEENPEVANTSFFNLCKSIIIKINPISASEIYAAEAICRFIAGSFYALVFSLMLSLVNAIFVYINFSFGTTLLPLFIVLVYSLLIIIILLQFRFMRFKEVDTVFFACFTNREEFGKCFSSWDKNQNNEY